MSLPNIKYRFVRYQLLLNVSFRFYVYEGTLTFYILVKGSPYEALYLGETRTPLKLNK